jgi:hypothetical protein
MDTFALLGPIVPFLLVMLFIVVIIKVFSASRGRDIVLKSRQLQKYRFRRKEYFMTKKESDFYKALHNAVGDEYIVFAQVHLSTIVDEKIEGQDWRAARAHIDRKSVDFVLCDKEYISPKLAIELDDLTHEREDRKSRDEIVEGVLAQAGVPLLRIKTSEHGPLDELAEMIRNKIQR